MLILLVVGRISLPCSCLPPFTFVATTGGPILFCSPPCYLLTCILVGISCTFVAGTRFHHYPLQFSPPPTPRLYPHTHLPTRAGRFPIYRRGWCLILCNYPALPATRFHQFGLLPRTTLRPPRLPVLPVLPCQTPRPAAFTKPPFGLPTFLLPPRCVSPSICCTYLQLPVMGFPAVSLTTCSPAAAYRIYHHTAPTTLPDLEFRTTTFIARYRSTNLNCSLFTFFQHMLGPYHHLRTCHCTAMPGYLLFLPTRHHF